MFGPGDFISYYLYCFYSSSVSEFNQHAKPMFFYISQKQLNGLKPATVGVILDVSLGLRHFKAVNITYLKGMITDIGPVSMACCSDGYVT